MTDTINDFSIDVEFFYNIQELSDKSTLELYEQLNECYSMLPKDNTNTLGLSGVMRSDEIFFELEFLNKDDEQPVFLNIKYTELDTYLDAVIKKETIEQLIKTTNEMEKISAYDNERIKHINYLMDTIHEQSSEIYEGMVDRDFEQLNDGLDSICDIINEIKKSISDEI
jgi:replicative DNA helicase